jgi:putative sigma-54 modulation protein
MQIQITGNTMEVTSAIREYAEKRLGALEKFLKDQGHEIMHIEIGQTSKHHKQGFIYRAEVTLNYNNALLTAVSEKDDLYTAIDDVREEMERQIVGNKNRRETLFRRGARSVKKMMKGISKRNPFTSKY